MKFCIRRKYEVFLFLILVIFAIIYWLHRGEDNREIIENLKITTGVIIDYEIIGAYNHYLTYEYFVDGTRYEESVIPDKYYLDCYKSRECIGKEIVVYYSSKNPEKSRLKVD